MYTTKILVQENSQHPINHSQKSQQAVHATKILNAQAIKIFSAQCMQSRF